MAAFPRNSPPDDPQPGRYRKSRSQRERYTRGRAARTAATADNHRARWMIDDARQALDLSRSVPDLARTLGRTAAAIEGLRAKWRSGDLPAALADQLPPYLGPAGDDQKGARK